jgi:hypothetical protein
MTSWERFTDTMWEYIERGEKTGSDVRYDNLVCQRIIDYPLTPLSNEWQPYLAVHIGINEPEILDNYDQYYEKNNPLVIKYSPLEEALQKVEKGTYTENHKCEQFSQDLVAELERVGIQSSIIYGESPKTLKEENIIHAWACIWLEPQTAQFTQNYVFSQRAK